MEKRIRNILVSLVLTLIIFSQSVPMQLWKAMADGITSIFSSGVVAENIDFTTAYDDTYNVGSGYILYENKSNRTENTKEYYMSDDTVMIQQFANSVHYYEDGEYKDINNTLVEKRLESGKSVFENKSNSFKVMFDKNSQKNTEAVEIEEDGYGFNIAYQATTEKDIEKTVKQTASQEKKDYASKRVKKPLDKESVGEYVFNSVEEKTDIVYQIKNKQLNKSIVISEKQKEYVYKFKLQSNNLQFVMGENGEILAQTKDQETKFVINTPYMIDDDGKISENVMYTLGNNGELVLTADSKWINTNATFPVRINPVIESARKNKQQIISVNKDGQTLQEKEYAYAGKKNGTENSDLFLNVQLQGIKPYYEILSADLSFDYRTQSVLQEGKLDFEYNVYVAESQETLKNITVDNKPKMVEKLASINGTKTSEDLITYQAEKINTNRISDNIITLGIESSSQTPDYAYIALAAQQSVSTCTYCEIISGIKDEYSMETFEIDGATAYVNNANGKITANIDVLSVNTLSDMPFGISLVYNNDYNSLLNTMGKTSYVGNNFKLNFEQYMVLNNGVYHLIDADGSVSAFHALGNNIYYSKDEKLYYNSSTRKVYDLVGNEMEFDTSGRLIKIISQNNSTEYITVSYSSNKISEISYYFDSAVKYKIGLGYNADNNKLNSITTYYSNGSSFIQMDSRNIAYDTNGNLSGVYYGIRQLFSIEYYNSHMNAIFNNLKDGLMFSTYLSGKVTSAMQAKGTGITIDVSRTLNTISFEYNENMTEIHTYENGRFKSTKYVAFDISKQATSTWVETTGSVRTVSNKLNWWKDEIIGEDETEYTDGTCNYYQESLTTNSITVNSGTFINRSIPNDYRLEDVDNSLHQYVLCFSITSSSAMNVIVRGGYEEETATIKTAQGGKMFVSIPMSYYDSSTINLWLDNNGNGTVYIKDIFYGVAIYNATTYTRGNNVYNPTQTVSQQMDGKITITDYDDLGRVSTITTKKIDTAELVESTRYTYKTGGVGKGKLISAITTDKENAEKERYTIDYNRIGNTYTEIYTTIIGDFIQRSTMNIEYTSNTSATITETDENNMTTTGYYALNNGDIRPWKVVYNNIREEYTYNDFGYVTGINVYDNTNNTLLYNQVDNYDTSGIYTGSTHNGQTYTYGYDNIGMITSISEGNATKLAYEYNYDDSLYGANKVSRKTYANGDYEEYVYEKLKTTLNYRKENGALSSRYVYHYANSNLIKQEHVNNYGETELVYEYDEFDKLSEKNLIINNLDYYTSYTSNIDVYNNRVKRTMLHSSGRNNGCVTMRDYQTDYTYNVDGQITNIATFNAAFDYEYDDMDRLISRTVSDHETKQNERYVYRAYAVENIVYQTNQLLRIEDHSEHQSYDRTSTYDNKGNIIGVSYNDNSYTYTYDDLGRIVSENGYNGLKTYSYDEYNNIQKDGLTYQNGKLVSVNNKSIVYDQMGNPTTYKGNAFTWEQGRKLVSGTMNYNTFTYDYDGNGMRYKKTVNGIDTEYYWNGSQLLYENREDGTERLFYIYDATGIAGFIYNRLDYYFDKNTLGDIVAIRDYHGTILATYEYDAWGNHIVLNASGMETTNSTFIGNINPFRYRGYYYDTETGFYYLQTRYYDPETCRFINADNYELIAQLSSTYELNLYTYCGNNPIMRVDETGEGLLTTMLIGALIGGLVGATTYTVSKVVPLIKGEWDWSWIEFFGSVAGGVIGGAISSVGSGFFAAFSGGATSCAFEMGLKNLFEGTNYTILEILFTSFIEGVKSSIGYAITKKIKIPKFNTGRGSYSAITKQIYTKLKNNIIKKISFNTLRKMFLVSLYESSLDIVA